MCYFALWQVIKKRRLVGGTLAIVRVKTLTRLPVGPHLRLYTFVNIFRSRQNKFRLSGRFAGSVKFSLFCFPLLSQFIGLDSSRSRHR